MENRLSFRFLKNLKRFDDRKKVVFKRLELSIKTLKDRVMLIAEIEEERKLGGGERGGRGRALDDGKGKG